MSETKIKPGARLTLHFELALEDGEVLDSNFDAQPATLTIGEGDLPDGFERLLENMAPGGQERFIVSPEQAFGQHKPDNVQKLTRDQFSSDLELVPGLVISFADAARSELPGVVTAVGEDLISVDFNHPLAGRTLSFRVHILDVQPALPKNVASSI